ncbi:cellulase family glycosylhydrolase [uncultured Cytophaga sp.]|uniref:cellulase family glycosylhydrolase n=1 Tax=uncultured Cytophaga sp. TaxID=160238 RepID=UPI0026078816|nr:cellulase family glycosylhydrolase [uncultured Cytophaga sp.]
MNLFYNLKRKFIVSSIFFCFAFVVHAQTPVAKYGQLKIFNGKVCDKNGNPVILRGMSMFWSGYPEGAPYYNTTTINWLRDDWCVDVIRATMSVETGSSTYINNPATELAKIKTVIDACIAKGIYVIVDFHSHNAENYKSQAKTFFTDIATTYGNQPNILYETFNEPINQSWSGTIKPYHNELITTIRAKDPDNIIICGTRTYSQDVDEAANDPVTGTNIAYTLHYYANSHKASLRQKATNALNKGVALFVTEYGTCDASGNGGYNAAESQTWWDFLEANKISSCNWAIDNKNETSAALTSGAGLSNWNAGQLTQSGTLVRNYIKGKCNSVLVTGSLTVAFAGNKVSYNAGDAVTMTATATISTGSVARVDYYDGANLMVSKPTNPYSYTTSTLSSGGHNITAKSYNAAGALVAESPLYTISIVGASNVSTTGITDQFETATQFSEMTGGTNDPACSPSSVTGAAAGIYWFEDRNAATPFKAEATRAGDGTLQYIVSQAANSYNVVGFNFGEYCVGTTKSKYTLDLSQNAVLKLTVSAPVTNTATLDLKFQMKDADGTVIAINKLVLLPNGTVDGPNWYKYEVGFSKNHVTPDFLSLAPNSTTNFVFDFKNALSIKNPNNPTFPADINTNNADFDFSKVVEVVIIPVNKLDTGAPNYQPLAFTDQKIIFSGLSMGDPSLGTDICTTPKAVVVSDISYCEGATDAIALKATGINGLTLKWYTTLTGGVANTVAPIPSTSVASTTTYYVSQATSSPNTCESIRSPLKVTVVAPITADAGVDQTITTAISAALVGTGSSVGTWTITTKPAAATVTFSPTAPSAAVTASGLTVDGAYVFKYTVAASGSCPAASSTMTVTKATPVCTTPTTANAGTAQSITTATSATLTGTGTVVGTWTVTNKPANATVTFSPSANAASVTANGLTVDGTYTFLYTVKGVSPCVDATSPVNVVKATPVCTTPTTANAGTAQSITTATSASLTGTGTVVGTWTVTTKPANATVTFSPSANAASVTANGLIVDGTYTFLYTVKGVNPCVDATSPVNVVKATPVCTTPTTANAGTPQSITTATSASLKGTGTTVGTWTVTTKPANATVTFSPSANAASVTANGLTVDGTYIFLYTVKGVSPCIDATSPVNVVKATPVCTTPTTANAGTPQSITTATTASLSGSGTKVGTWTIITVPTGAAVTLSPTGAAAAVTASGLTVNGTYTFKYTVTGTSPCVDAFSTVDVVKSVAPCTVATTANAGTGQTITTANTASLKGTGTSVGTWTVQTKPDGAAITLSPTGASANVTANGLTVDGTYTFLYTVTGVSPCGNATSTVNVVKSTPTCTTPTTANAGTAQSITTATSASLTGTGTSIGKWTIQNNPANATVTLSTSGASATVTASGLTVDGTYTFLYTVTGVSPCGNATSTVNVVKSTPTCLTPTTANAGSAQSITAATTASLIGSGSKVGTWTVVNKPEGASVTFNPTGASASVTASGLTLNGTYTFKYTVLGTSPCVDASATVDVVKSTAPCVTPTIANAGTAQSISTATTVTLSGTGTSIGTWSLLTGPSTVSFGTSANMASLTVTGLTAVGDYTFQYSVAGTSPCVTATSPVVISKTTTTGINAAYLDANIQLYPNPVTDRLQVDVSNVGGIISLKMYDMLGRIIYSTENASIENVDMSDLSNGIYVIHIQSDYGTYSKTVVKQ